MNRIEQRMEKSAIAMIQALNKAKMDWMDAQMKRIMPVMLYALAQDAQTKAKLRKQLAKWVTDNKVVVREQPSVVPDPEPFNGHTIMVGLKPSISRSTLMLGEKPISEFSVRYKDGKCEIMVKDFPIENQAA